VTPRQLAMYIAKKFTSRSLVEIAAKFEKSHATILHGVKSITKRLDVEEDLKSDLEAIISELGYSMSDTVD
jgi:chromosomal replication initiator protein